MAEPGDGIPYLKVVGQVNFDRQNEINQFLQEIFPDHTQHAIFAEAHAPSDSWKHIRAVENLDSTRDCYLSIAAFPDDKSNERTLTRAVEVRCLVIDDVGAEIPAAAVEKALGKPTAEVLTSEGNAHWWYVLEQPMPVAEWKAFFTEVARRMGTKTHGPEAHHVFRIPMGVNTKPERNGFRPCLGQFNPGTRLDAAGIMLFAEPVPKSKLSDEPIGMLGLECLRELMACIPNDGSIDREIWVNIIGHGLKALCADDDEGFEVFDEFTETWTGGTRRGSGYNRRCWDSFGASGGLTSRGGNLKALAEQHNPERFAQWKARVVFDDGEVSPEEPIGPGPPKSSGITATPYQWVDLDKIPPRDWLYADILIRKFISMTVAPGGVGKSSLITVETLAQVTGQDLLGARKRGMRQHAPMRAWLWNLEDPFEETQRKIQAAAKYYGISAEDIGGRLFADSGRDQKLVIAKMDRNGVMIMQPVVNALVEQIKLRGIDIVVIDPFVSCHEAPENDNTAQDMIVKEWGRVAEQGNCAVHLVDHTSKAGSEVVVTDSARGAKSKTDAARVVRVVNRMTKTEGEKVFGIKDVWRYFHTFNDKANMAPPTEDRDWFHMESLNTRNSAQTVFDTGSVGSGEVEGDSIGIVRRWVPPSAQDLVTGDNWKAMVMAMGDKQWMEAPQSGEKWIGIPAAIACGLDAHFTSDREAIKVVLARWFKAGLLKEVAQLNGNRKLRKFIQIAGGF